MAWLEEAPLREILRVRSPQGDGDSGGCGGVEGTRDGVTGVTGWHETHLRHSKDASANFLDGETPEVPGLLSTAL